MKSIWKKISQYPGLSEEQQPTYRNFNLFLIIGLFDLFVIGLVLKDVEPRWPFYLCLAEFTLFVAMMALHMKGHFSGPRFVTFLLTIVLQIVASLTHGQESGLDYIFLVLCILPMLFFENPKIYGSLFFISLGSMLTVHYLYNTVTPIVSLDTNFLFYWNIIFAASMIFIAVYVFKSGYRQQQTSLEEQNRLILLQKKDIEKINNNLEKIVNERTYKIIQQQQKLREFANINSHKVRTPLARMLGLITVIEIETKPDKALIEYLPLLKSNAEELDVLLKEVNDTLRDLNTPE